LWRCQTRVGLKKETLEWMKKSGCFLIAFGVESGSQKILDNVNKEATVEMIIETFKNCKDVGILTHSYLMIGNVGETKETLNETLELMKKIKPFSYNISISTPYPGTYLYEYAKNNQLEMDSNWEKYDHILSGSVLKLSEFELDELPLIKKEMEEKINKITGSERLAHIWRLVFDRDFIFMLLRIILFNPGMPFRMLNLVKRMFTKKGYGYRMTNPLTGA
ncbi:MAG: radical SAM protein, partial [Nanoarchaeota archaeon]